MKNEKKTIILAGCLMGVIASLLVHFGNPANMGFCIACFLRDTVGGLGLHQAKVVQYIRPEIMGLVLGSFMLAWTRNEFQGKGGSSPMTRFTLGFAVMVGCLMFLGCPFRMILRLAGGDLNALAGLAGFAAGIWAGIYFLTHGYSLKRTYKTSTGEGLVFPGLMVVLMIILVSEPGLLLFTKAGGGPGGAHAPIFISLMAGLIVGGLAQYTRMCMVGGIRDMLLFKDNKLLLGFIALFVSALACNLLLTSCTEAHLFKLGLEKQPIAHTDGLWNFLGMALAGYGCVLLGGCPLRQLVLTGEGNTDSALTVVGLMAGAAFAHNWGLASSGAGPTFAGKVAVILCLALVTAIAMAHSKRNS